MEPTDITVHILREIRDEIHTGLGQVREEIQNTNARVDQTNERLDTFRDELGRRLVESEIRTSTAMADLVGTVREVRDLLSDRLDLRDRVERCERDIDSLKTHVGI
jgi:uncharacterized coiled-coil DUF342 family protein